MSGWAFLTLSSRIHLIVDICVAALKPGSADNVTLSLFPSCQAMWHPWHSVMRLSGLSEPPSFLCLMWWTSRWSLEPQLLHLKPSLALT